MEMSDFLEHSLTIKKCKENPYHFRNIYKEKLTNCKTIQEVDNVVKESDMMWLYIYEDNNVRIKDGIRYVQPESDIMCNVNRHLMEHVEYVKKLIISKENELLTESKENKSNS